MNSDKIQEYIKERVALSKAIPESRDTFDRILAWMDDPSGTAELSALDEKIYTRWKHAFTLRLDGKTIPQIVENLTKFHGVSDRTARKDVQLAMKLFKVEFLAEVELQVLYEKTQKLINRFSNSNNPKILAILPKLIKEQKEIAILLDRQNTTDPELMKPHTIIVTANPQDIGITEELPSVEELIKRFKSKIDKNIEDAEFEDVEY